MKTLGSKSEFTLARNNMLLDIIRDKIRDARRINTFQIIFSAIHSPAPRFYISEESALRALRHGDSRSRTHAEMVEDLRNLVGRYRREHPEASYREAVAAVIQAPAPRFYLTFESARSVIYRHIRSRKPARCAKGAYLLSR